MDVCMHLCIDLCMDIGLDVRIGTCVDLCMCMCIGMRIGMNIDMRTCIDTCIGHVHWKVFRLVYGADCILDELLWDGSHGADRAFCSTRPPLPVYTHV